MATKEKKPETALAVKDAAQLLVGRVMPSVLEVLPDHIDKRRYERILLSCVRLNEKLQKCTLDSFGNAVMQAAQLGLEPGSALKESCLVPFGSECTYISQYAGVVKLMVRAKAIRCVRKAVEVYERDEFDFEEGTSEFLHHKKVMGGERGAVIAAYVKFLLMDGTEKFEIMRWDDILKVRDRSRGYQAAVKYNSSHPWKTDEIPMGVKTVLLRGAKYLSKASVDDDVDRLALALEMERNDIIEGTRAAFADKQQRGRHRSATLRGTLGVVDSTAEVVPQDAPDDDPNGSCAEPPPPIDLAPPEDDFTRFCPSHKTSQLKDGTKENGDAYLFCPVKSCKHEELV